MTEISSVSAKSILGEIYKIFCYTEVERPTKVNMQIEQESQVVYPNGDILLVGVETIDTLQLTGSGNGKVAISFDSGASWKAYLNGVWETVFDASEGMTISEINSLTPEQLSEAKGENDAIRFSYYLTNDTHIDNMKMVVSLVGTEELANKNNFDLSYDKTNTKIIYTINKNGTYAINYNDGK